MSIDATQAALIGAGIGAAATTAGSALTALVTRRNSAAQHLYVKRAEVYEDLLRGMATWMDKTPEGAPGATARRHHSHEPAAPSGSSAGRPGACPGGARRTRTPPTRRA